MKRILLSLVFLASLLTLSAVPTLEARIDRYAGDHAAGLHQLLTTLPPDTLQYVRFILDNASDPDLAVLTADIVRDNVRLALKARELPFAKDVPEQEFLHFVLPLRMAQEPYEPWRKVFYDELAPQLKDVQDIETAITKVNIWCAEQMTFVPTNGRDQGPLTTVKRMHGRCEEMMILFVAAARSVGIPARSAYTPYWNFSDNNHAWTEVWTPAGWKFLGSAEPSNRLSDAWFTNTTKRATLVLSDAFGEYDSPTTLRSKDGMSLLNSTSIYTHPKKATIQVRDASGKAVEKATIMLYGASYGGEMAMQDLTTDAMGNAFIELGPGALWVTAAKDSLFAAGVLDVMQDGPELKLVVTPDHSLNTNFTLRFPLPTTTPDSLRAAPVLCDFDTEKELAELRFAKKHAESSQPMDFLPYFELTPKAGETDAEFSDRRKSYLDNCAELAGSEKDYLSILARLEGKPGKAALKHTLMTMLTDWDVKDLVELPDTAAILAVAQVYTNAKGSLPDSLWEKHILDTTFGQRPCPETGWEPELYRQTASLSGADFTVTADNVRQWIDRLTVVDDSLRFTYFTGAMTPLDILRERYIPESRRKIIAAAVLKELGVPVRWRGFLEYWNGKEFVAFYPQKQDERPRVERTLTVSLDIDGKPVRAAAFENYFLSCFEGGEVTETYFDPAQDSLSQKISFPEEPGKTYYLEAMTRNSNGDANVVIVSLDRRDSYQLDLKTPKEYVDQTARWSDLTRKELVKHTKKWAKTGRPKLVIVLHKDRTEPQMRIFDELWNKRSDLQGADIVVWCDGGMSSLLTNEQVQTWAPQTGASWIAPADLPGDPKTTGFVQQNYPVVFLFNAQGEIVFSSSGYQMGLGDLLVRKVQDQK